MTNHMPDITVVIIARNAEATIGRAVTSARTDSDAPILLVDDFSTDATAEVARRANEHAARGTLEIVSPTERLGVGNARQTALEAITTPYGIWLDADDAFLPGRTARHLSMLTAGAHDLVYDSGELMDGDTGAKLYDVPVPDHLMRPGGLWHQLERNWLPLLTGGFDVSFARRVGYDRAFENAEDYDFLLRAMMAGARIGLVPTPGYQYFHASGSRSRQFTNSCNFFGRAHAKHAASDIKMALAKSGLPKPEQAYMRCASAMLAGDHIEAHKQAAALASLEGTVTPYGQSARTLSDFLLGSLALLRDDPAAAVTHLEAAASAWQTPEVANNLALALWRAGKQARATAQWQQLVDTHPDYLDAKLNLRASQDGSASRLTKLPLRPVADRSDYGAWSR